MSDPEHGRAWLVAGAPGSGKTTFGRALARRTGAVLLDQDVLTNPLLAQVAALAGAGEDLDHPALRGNVRTARYRCLLDAAMDNLALGLDVVLVAPFSSEIDDPVAWDRMRIMLRPTAATLVWVRVPAEVASARRQRRNLSRDAAAASTPPVSRTPSVTYRAVDGLANPQAEAARVADLPW